MLARLACRRVLLPKHGAALCTASSAIDFTKFAYTLTGAANSGNGLYGDLLLAITNECRGESLVSLRGPGFDLP